MNVANPLELWAGDLFKAFFHIQASSYYSNITNEILGLAKANVTEHVTTLLCTQNNESIAEFINLLSERIGGYSRKQNYFQKLRNVCSSTVSSFCSCCC